MPGLRIMRRLVGSQSGSLSGEVGELAARRSGTVGITTASKPRVSAALLAIRSFSWSTGRCSRRPIPQRRWRSGRRRSGRTDAARLEQLAVPGIAFDDGEAQRRKLAQLGEGNLDDPHAGGGKPRQRARERRRHRGLEVVEHQRLRHGEAQAVRARTASSELPLSPASTASIAAQQATELRERADRVERRRERNGALDRHAARRRLEAGDAAERRRHLDRARGVGARAPRAPCRRRPRPRAPDDEPPGIRPVARSQGLSGVP